MNKIERMQAVLPEKPRIIPPPVSGFTIPRT